MPWLMRKFYQFIDWVMSKDTRTGRVSEEEMRKSWQELEDKAKMDKDKDQEKPC